MLQIQTQSPCKKLENKEKISGLSISFDGPW